MRETALNSKGRMSAKIAMALGFALSAAASEAADAHKLALYITVSDPAKMSSILDNAANVTRLFTGVGEEVDIVIVGFGPGVSMLLADRSPVAERVKGFEKSMPNVRFEACANSIEAIEKREHKRPAALEDVSTVESGVAELLTLSEKGYTVVQP